MDKLIYSNKIKRKWNLGTNENVERQKKERNTNRDN